MIKGMLAADSDMHVMEPADLWQRYMDPAWEHAAPVGMTEIERDMRVKVKNQVMLRLGRMRPRQVGRPWKAAQDSAFVHAEERELGRQVAGDGDGPRAPRLDRPVPEPRAVRPVTADRRPHRPGRARARPRARDRAGLQRLDARLLPRGARPHVGCRDAGAPRRRRVGRRARPLCRGIPVQGRVPRPRARRQQAVARPEVRPALARGRTAGRAGVLPRGRSDVPRARLRVLEPPRQADAVAPVQPAARHPVRGDVLHVRRNPRALSRAAGRTARGQLLVGAVHDVPARRALGMDGQVRGAGRADGTVAVPAAQLLPRGRGRRAPREVLRRGVRRRQPHLLDRLPARRLEVPRTRPRRS